MILPFIENKIEAGIYFRTFSENVEDSDLIWHRDKEDRFIESIHQTDWKFQIDDCLPQNFDTKIFVPKGVYHRIIKGTGDLILKINKLK